MANCRQACPFNTLDGCKVKEYNAICPLTNMANPITEYRMTNADRIRAMSDEELAEYIDSVAEACYNAGAEDLPLSNSNPLSNAYNILEWLKQPAEE